MLFQIALRLLILATLFGLACGCSFAGDTAAVAAATPDARLAQKVTYEARFKSVGQIMDDLSALTGIKITGGYNRSDWQVYGRKMNIFVKDVRFSDLMHSIARAMKFRWGRSGDLNPPVYRVVVDSKAVNQANAKKARAEEQSEEMWRARRDEWLQIIMRDGLMSPSEIDAVRETDPVLYRHAKPGALRALRALFVESPEAKDAFASGWSFRISADELSEETRGLLLSVADEFAKFMQRGYGREPQGNPDIFKEGNKMDIAYTRLDVGSFTPNLRWSVYTQGSTGYFHLSMGEKDPQIVSLGDKDTDWTRALCERENTIIDGLGDFNTTRTALYNNVPKLEADRKKEEEALYPSEPLIEHAGLTGLADTIKIKMDKPKTDESPALSVNSSIASFQKAVADASGMGVVSDSWVNIDGEKLPDQDARLGELLDKFSTQFNYNWDKAPSGILEFRHRKWWKNRLNQIPDEWVSGWRNNTIKNRILSLDDLAGISNLTYEQAEESVKPDRVLGVAGLYKQIVSILDANGNLQCLQLYSTLSRRQRAMLTAEYGLSASMLTSRQWDCARAIFDRIGTSRGEAVFRLEPVPNDKQVIFQFREFDGDSGEEDRKWEVTLLKYTPPAVQAGVKQ